MKYTLVDNLVDTAGITSSSFPVILDACKANGIAAKVVGNILYVDNAPAVLPLTVGSQFVAEFQRVRVGDSEGPVLTNVSAWDNDVLVETITHDTYVPEGTEDGVNQEYQQRVMSYVATYTGKNRYAERWDLVEILRQRGQYDMLLLFYKEKVNWDAADTTKASNIMTMEQQIDFLNEKREALIGMNPIPADYADNSYWT